MLPRLLALFTLSAYLTLLGVYLGTPTKTQIESPVAEIPEVVVEPVVPEWTRLCGPNSDPSLDLLIEQVAAEYDIEPAMLATLAKKESTCNPNAVGGAGEIGLTQIHPKVWTRMLIKEGLITEAGDLFDPETNLRCSAYILSGLLNRTDGDVWKTFRKYNGAGPKARQYANHALTLYNGLR